MIAPSPARLAVAALVLNALVWGVSWWPFRQLQFHGVHPLWATAIVYGFAVVCVLLVRPWAWVGLLRHPALWLLALASGLTNVGFNWAVTTGDVMRVVLLFYMMPAWSVLLAWLVLGDRPNLTALIRMAIALLGVLLVLKTPGSAWPMPHSAADYLALMGGLCFALTNVLLRHQHASPSASRMLAMFAGGAITASAVAVLGSNSIAAVPALSMAWLPMLGGLAIAFLLGNMALQYGAARLRASTTSLVMLSEIVFASASSIALGAATLGAKEAIGGALIVLAAAWASLSEK
jgi:drug/metabolite transporter (DMT)-like permease